MTRIRWSLGSATLVLALALSLGAASAGSATPAIEKEVPVKERVYEKPAIKDVTATHITKESAEIEGKIDPWGSETEYEIWFWPGCFEGSCERVSPHVAKTGTIAAGY